MVRLSNANIINNYPQPVFHFNESQLRCVKVIVAQTLQGRPLAAHASKFRVSENTPLSLRYSRLPANVFRGSSCVSARGTSDEPPKIVSFILYISLNFTIRTSWTWRGLKTIHLPFLREGVRCTVCSSPNVTYMEDWQHIFCNMKDCGRSTIA